MTSNSVPQTTNDAALGALLEARLLELATHSEETGRLTRQYLSVEHRTAMELVSTWMREAGMQVRTDAAANLIGRIEGSRPEAPALVMGSHLDTVRDAGLYDGALGIVLPILCLEALSKQGWQPECPIEVVAFGDEEGTRFQSTYLGSRAMAGNFDMELLSSVDSTGMTLSEALAGFGFEPETLRKAGRASSEVAAYVEVHIEQGPVLEAEQLAVGVVTSIAGATRLSIELRGEAGHAGTVPMHLRKDAMSGAAEIVSGIERICQGADLVGTVGQLAVSPGAVNVIPGQVVFSVDVRSGHDATREEAVTAIRALLESVCQRRRLSFAVNTTHQAGSVACDEALSDTLAAAVASTGTPIRRLPSGAGHDAAAMASLSPVAMLFVRCRGGLSHHPDEYMSAEDGAAAASVVMHFLQDFAGR